MDKKISTYDPTIFPEQPERAASIVGEREKELRVGLVAEGGRPHVRQRRPHRRHLSLRSTPGQSLGSSTTAQSISPYNVRARGSTLFWQNSIGFSFFVQVHGKQKISKTTFQSASHIYIGRMKYLQEVCCNRRPINGNVVWSHLYISSHFILFNDLTYESRIHYTAYDKIQCNDEANSIVESTERLNRVFLGTHAPLVSSV